MQTKKINYLAFRLILHINNHGGDPTTMSKRNQRKREVPFPAGLIVTFTLLGVFLIILGLLTGVSVLGYYNGNIFSFITNRMNALGGYFSVGISILLIWEGIIIFSSTTSKVSHRNFLLMTIFYLCILGLINLLSTVNDKSFIEHLIATNKNNSIPKPDEYLTILQSTFQFCVKNKVGGVLGMILSYPLWKYTNTAIAVIILSIIALICLLSIVRFNFMVLFTKKPKYHKEKPTNYPQNPENYQDNAPLIQPHPMYQGYTANGFPMANGFAQSNVNSSFPTPINEYSPNISPNSEKLSPQPKSKKGFELLDSLIAKTEKFTSSNSKKNQNSNKASNSTPENYPFPSIPSDNEQTPVTSILDSIPAEKRSRAVRKTASQLDEINRRNVEIATKLALAQITPNSEAKNDVNSSNTFNDMNDVNHLFPPTLPPQNPKEISPSNSSSVVPTVKESTPVTTVPSFSFNDNSNNIKPIAKTISPNNSDIPTVTTHTAPTKTVPSLASVYVPPPFSLLKEYKRENENTQQRDIENAKKLENTLNSFNIPAAVQRVTHGPAVTRFEVGLLKDGINVKRILGIEDTIALNMASNGSLRIEIPIPGTNLFGIEVPNEKVQSIGLREVLQSPEMLAATSPLAVALGQDITGRPIICDIAKMPHLLIAGQTGSGKSVCINTIINSLLFRTSPKDVRLIMIDPKIVELQGYNTIPHLLIPVVSDPKKASGALAWAVAEMDDRYQKMQEKGARELSGYNQKLSPDEEPLPRIVIIIDELADLMMVCKKDVEESIIRLAQKARAAGIHVILATQRPTVDVITGLIKSNVPSRIAFAVTSNLDSRTILDTTGAEKLLGRGDMFYRPNGSNIATRVQGCFLGDDEIENIVDYVSTHNQSNFDQSILDNLENTAVQAEPTTTKNTPQGEDDLLDEAIEIVFTHQQASISLLQRKLQIGFARAGRIIDAIEAKGIIGEASGSKPRQITMTHEEYLQNKNG